VVLLEHDVLKPPGGRLDDACAFHPVLCTSSDEDQFSGTSLIDATACRACSLITCGVIRLTIDDVLAAAQDEFPASSTPARGRR
jgi:hypothetical protein